MVCLASVKQRTHTAPGIDCFSARLQDNSSSVKLVVFLHLATEGGVCVGEGGGRWEAFANTKQGQS